MLKTHIIELRVRAHDMAQEEIGKKVVHLSKGIANVRFSPDGGRLLFDAAEEVGAQISDTVAEVASGVQRALRNLVRKVVFRSPNIDYPNFLGNGACPGVHYTGNGQAALTDVSLQLFRYFDRRFASLGKDWKPRQVLTPTLIPVAVLAKCDYFRSFPHNVTFAAHLEEDVNKIDAFRARHHDLNALDDLAMADMETPEACLSPATCYHIYHMLQGSQLEDTVRPYDVCGKCFRYESSNMRDLRRLWDFTMRELVFLGTKDYVLTQRDRWVNVVANFLVEHSLAGEIRTASDPFFIAPDAAAKTYFQLSAETKYEVSLLLPDDERLAVGSLNYHTDFFGRSFDIALADNSPAHSVCIAFGLERWVYAFIAQHGIDPTQWPSAMTSAPEFDSRTGP